MSSPACSSSAWIIIGVVATAWTAGLPQASAQTQASFQGLGHLPGGTLHCTARAVSRDGTTVVGGSSGQAFRWTATGGMVSLGDLPGGATASFAWGVSDNGAVVVGESHSINGSEAFRWEAGAMIGLGDLPGGFFQSAARGVSADGTVIVGYGSSPVPGNPTSGMNRAVRWDSGAMTVLGNPTGTSHVVDVSSSGTVGAGASHDDNALPTDAVLWSPSLVPLPAATNFAWGISSDGTFVAGGLDGGGAFRWSAATGVEAIGGGVARGISDRGDVVVGVMLVDSQTRAFIWDASNGMRDLKNVLENDFGLNLGGWSTLYEATDISGDGQTIVGFGQHGSTVEGWVAVLPDEDSDGDGLLDSWESEGQGLDVNGDGTIDLDLHALGARPDHKDLFIEIDCMTGRPPVDLSPVVAAFDAAPVPNPDGASGVRLHLHIDDTDLPMGGGWPVDPWPVQFDNLKSLYFGTAAERNDPNSVAILEAKHKAFRYCIYADTCLTHNGGVARDVHCNDFIVFKGEFLSLPSLFLPPWEQAMFMHELGHCLGLGHGGGDEVNLKPNYISVMNYLYSLPFSAGDAWRLDFSRGTMLPIIEGNIDESVMLDDPAGHNVGVLTYHALSNCPPSTCNLTPTGLVPALGYLIGTGPKDFNGDGQIHSGQCMDLNYYGTGSPITEGGVHTPCDLMNDHNDWASLQYALVEQASPLTGGPPTNPPVELTIAEIQALHAALPDPPCLADIVASGAVDIDDLLAVISAWGPCPALPSPCDSDIAPLPVDGQINIDDLLAVIAGWGACG